MARGWATFEPKNYEETKNTPHNTSEPKPFLTADSVGKKYKSKDGKEGRIVGIDKDGCFVFRWRDVCWLVYANGRNLTGVDCMTVLPPAPPEPERRTVWLNVYSDRIDAFLYKDNADFNGAFREGEAVPVPLERQPDGEWRVVQELTPKQKAAEEMYKALSQVKIHCDNKKIFPFTENELRHIVSNALAKAEGRE